MCQQHGRDIRHLLETKLQHVFGQIREEYDQQCAHLLTNIDRDLTQMNLILQDINSKLDTSSSSSSIDPILSLSKQTQRLDVLTKNLEYDWQIIAQTSTGRFSRHFSRKIYLFI